MRCVKLPAFAAVKDCFALAITTCPWPFTQLLRSMKQSPHRPLTCAGADRSMGMNNMKRDLMPRIRPAGSEWYRSASWGSDTGSAAAAYRAACVPSPRPRFQCARTGAGDGRHVFDQDNKGWKAVSNALKGLVIDDDDQYHLSVHMMSSRSAENVCHISLVLPESAEEFFRFHQKGIAYSPLEPSVMVNFSLVSEASSVPTIC